MPRGVYARKSAQQKTAGKGTVTAKAKAKAAPKASKLAAVATTPAAQLADAAPEPQFSVEDFRRPIDEMSGALLKAFARKVGIKQRDVDGLTEDRLRQNCKVMQLAALED
jgi:isopenicillin N synthase-like dioxygenase